MIIPQTKKRSVLCTFIASELRLVHVANCGARPSPAVIKDGTGVRRAQMDIFSSNVLLYTAILEGITCLFRFGFGWRSSRPTAFLARVTRGYRIHHGYIGLILAGVCLLGEVSPGKVRLFEIAAALFFSDIIHHFLVLWPLTGHHEFDLRYRNNGEKRIERSGELS